MKFTSSHVRLATSYVAPFAGAWIEILSEFDVPLNTNVAPFAGAWIEILTFSAASLKASVAPFAGAWIEIFIASLSCDRADGRSLRGSVD